VPRQLYNLLAIMFRSEMILLLAAALLLSVQAVPDVVQQAQANANAEEARWLVHEADWGYLSSLDGVTQHTTAQVASFSDGAAGASTGRLFFYLMTEDPGGDADEPPEKDSFAAALTMSQAVVDPADYEKSQCGATKDTEPLSACATSSSR
jgi:hypothetical protein